MMAAAMIPMAAIIGSGVDMSRAYLLRNRLQHACDAGALASRRAMSGATLTEANKVEGRKFFDFNFPTGSVGITAPNITRSYVDGTVPGTVKGLATATMATTLTKIVGVNNIAISVDCVATVSVPNTDVMFVLDVTGSMGETIDGVTKLAGLKTAVKDFYKELGPGTATGGGRVRYGFTPYSSAVNVGNLVKGLDQDYLLGENSGETHTYNSRELTTTTTWTFGSYGTESAQSYSAPVVGAWSPSSLSDSNYTALGSSGTTTVGGTSYSNRISPITSANCAIATAPAAVTTNSAAVGPTYDNSNAFAYPDATRTNNYDTSQTSTRVTYRYVHSTSGSGRCNLQRATQTRTTDTASTTTQPINWVSSTTGSWLYKKKTFNVTGFVAGSATANPAFTTNAAVLSAVPGINDSAPSSFTWGGCIEESSTVNTITATTALSPIPSGAKDLDIDLKPTANADKWKPMLPQLTYDTTSGIQWHGASTGWLLDGWSACPAAAKGLQQYVSDYSASTDLSSSFTAYVDGLTAIGGTYHDIGMIWGARMLSPDGIFTAANSSRPGGFKVNRHIVFMTDGAFDTRAQNYDAWGINRLDGRLAPTTTTATASLIAIHQRRLEMICKAAQSKGFTIWVIGFGITDLSQQLKDCASDDEHWAIASNGTSLSTKFRNIAEQIGSLRLAE